MLYEVITEAGLDPLMQDVEGPLIPVLCAMEQTGILVDAQQLERLSHEFGERLVERNNFV